MNILAPNKLISILTLSMVMGISYSQPGEMGFKTIKAFDTHGARQGIAVDAEYFYTINTKGIGKYNKKSGQFIIEWQDTSGRIIHLDGGMIVKERLYCAHSNYPAVPMTSSIEVFATNDLKHIYSHSFGIKYGSCTWADYFKNSWWVCFANYDQFEKTLNTNTSWTTLVRFDKNWNETGSWVFPENLLSEFRPMSCSGGSLGPDGNIYVTGHDSSEVYILCLPETGSVLRYLGSVKIESEGQGIAWDRSDKNILYGIVRKQDKVIVSEFSPVK